ncbi:hypothetical protein EXIGLDRAFT_833187 [Exidia glandulosa HHB12029]|uniref:Uncharacterized protein n=1 Tax=Exidia glandulosa HHB12029 TaxID=1314781 RepID=A0A165KY14_EXIGL|nr:hypothetical protein EXIGLDRAFT_833187 [Exidia glandulosa HHB12029]
MLRESSASRLLPRECVDRILRHDLAVPTSRFWNDSFSEFDKRQREAGHTRGVSWDPCCLLLVCKLWRTLGEPLLYHTVVIRSLAQAHTLADTFRFSPALGSFVYRLRLEGAYGHAGVRIIQSTAATVSDLWLSLHPRMCDDWRYEEHLFKAQYAAFTSLNPARVNLSCGDLLKPDSTTYPYIIKALAQWWRLKYCCTSFIDDSPGAHEFSKALGNLPSLEVLEVAKGWGVTLPTFSPAATAPSLNTVVLPEELDEVSQWLSNSRPDIVIRRSYEPQTLSVFRRQFPEEILHRIIGYAVAYDFEFLRVYEYWGYEPDVTSIFLRISKQFNRLTLFHMCRRPFLHTAARLTQFTNMVRSHPSDALAKSVVSVDLAFAQTPINRARSGLYSQAPLSSTNLANNTALAYFVSTMLNLRLINVQYQGTTDEGFMYLQSWSIEALAGLEHLEELSGVGFGVPDAELGSSTLALFTALKKLLNFSWLARPCLEAMSPWSGVFASLRELEIRELPKPAQQPMMWSMLEAMDLPQLYYLGCEVIDFEKAAKFLEKHGKKLTRIAFHQCYGSPDMDPCLTLTKWCPNLVDLEFWSNIYADMDWHPGVLRMTINTANSSNLKHWVREAQRQYGKDTLTFPNLQEIHCHTVGSWRKSQYQEWQQVSDMLRRTRGIVLFNHWGVAWRPRLQHPDARDPEAFDSESDDEGSEDEEDDVEADETDADDFY